MKKPDTVESASALIDARIQELADWRGDVPAARVAGTSWRAVALAFAVASGVVVAFAAISLDGPWMQFHGG